MKQFDFESYACFLMRSLSCATITKVRIVTKERILVKTRATSPEPEHSHEYAKNDGEIKRVLVCFLLTVVPSSRTVIIDTTAACSSEERDTCCDKEQQN